jgi:hypothetical protein
MKIYFCDACNESIPLQDIKDNMAATLKGKIYCRNCNPLKDVVEQRAPAPAPAFNTLLMVVIIVLLVVVIGLMVFYKGAPDVEYASTGDLQDASRGLERNVNAQIDLMRQELTSIDENLKQQVLNLSKMESELMVIRGDVQGLKSENENMSKNFQSVTNVRERLDTFILKQDEFSTALAENNADLERYRGQLKELDKRLEKMSMSLKTGSLFSSGKTSDWQPAATGESAEVKGIREKLESKDAGTRFEAVYQVLDERIKAALPFVLPLIEDPDQFVQVGAIQTVGEFLYQEALPVLVKVLRDPDATVRDESLRQLIRMTGKNDLNFDVRGSDSEREKAIRKWEKWLKEGR